MTVGRRLLASLPAWLIGDESDGHRNVRVGSTNRRADAELIAELRRFARGEGFDEQPMPGLDSEAIDFRAASESFAPFRKLARRDLETLRLVTDHQGRKVPTVGGMLLFGKDRERHFPDSWIQAGRFRGTNKSHIVDRTEIRSLAARAVSRTNGRLPARIHFEAVPTVLRSGPYRVYFYSHEPGEPPHVHVDRENFSAKFWLLQVEAATNFGYGDRELRVIQRILVENRERLLKAWNDYFGT